MKKVMVTGASGFIGMAVVKSLSDQGHHIDAVYNSILPGAIKNVVWHKADLLNKNEVEALFANLRPEYLIQLAWCTGQGSYWTDPKNLDWLSANLIIASEFARHGGKKCLFAGTSAEYDWALNMPLNESSTLLKPILLYGGTKLSVFWTLTRYFEQMNVKFSWARFFNPFGPGEDQKRLIPKTCLALLNGKQLTFDAAISRRDFLHVSDVGDAVTAVLLSESTGPINIGSGEQISVREVVLQIARNFSLETNVRFDSDDHLKPADSVVADTFKLNNEVSWKAAMSFSERLQETCNWWKFLHKQ